MRSFKIAVVAWALAGGVMGPQGASAQPKDPIGPSGGPGASQGLRRDMIEKMRAMRAWKLAEELKLDEPTSSKLFPLLSRYDEREGELARERHEVTRALRAEIEAPKPDNARVSGYVEKLLAFRAKQRAIEDEKTKDLRKILTPVQQAKILLLLPRMDNHFQQRIRDAVERRRERRAGQIDDPFPF